MRFLMPFWGSVRILIPLYRMEIGKTFEGCVVSQSLNSALQFQGLSWSTIFSSEGIKDGAR
jgi:hypothetical protein